MPKEQALQQVLPQQERLQLCSFFVSPMFNLIGNYQLLIEG
jgi:hypothetical protein